jgi:hypothetical protein
LLALASRWIRNDTSGQSSKDLLKDLLDPATGLRY